MGQRARQQGILRGEGISVHRCFKAHPPKKGWLGEYVSAPGTPGKVFSYFPPFLPLFSHFFVPVLGTPEKAY